MKRKPEKKMGVLHAAYGQKVWILMNLVLKQLHSNRCRSSACPIGIDPVCADEEMVLPLFSFDDHRALQCRPIDIGVQAEVCGWCGLYLVRISWLILIPPACISEIGQEASPKSTSNNSSLRQILPLKSVHLLSFYILVYVGLEATIGGWIVTYVLQARDGGPSSGYISTGFFGGVFDISQLHFQSLILVPVGIMLGRVLLLQFNQMVSTTILRLWPSFTIKTIGRRT
jgi:hypothetical protein